MASIHPAKRTLIILLGACLFIVACSSEKTDDSLSRISLQLDWFPEPEQGGFFQAEGEGLYETAGIKVEFLSGGPNSMVLQKVATKKATFGLWRSDDVIAAISKGMPLQIVGVYMQHDPQGVMFHESAEITSFKDLDGRSVMAGQASLWIEYVQKKYDISFNIIPLGYSLIPFLSDENYIQQCFVTSEPYFAIQKGAHPKTFLVSDSGFDPYRVIVTHNDFAANHPDIVQAFLDASYRGWENFLQGDGAAGIKILKTMNDEADDPFIQYVRGQLASQQLVAGNPDEGEFIGKLTSDRLNEQIEQLLEFGFIPEKLKASDIANFDFSPKGNYISPQ